MRSSSERLALAVVDEQHRFGVRQRTALDRKAPGDLSPHLLHLTATPIPRTLSLTLYGDLDTTALRELPRGRRPVKTWVVPEHKRDGAYEFIRERLREGRQCFVVCPLVEESEALQARAATAEAERLAHGELRDFRVEVMHGQMHARDKRAAMARFAAGETNVLVATSVIEVGIDVPNASVMMIEEADRYGISQLHQLRGRVGRGAHESYCLLFSDARSELARRRLDAVAAERDGFRLAEVDLTLRGEGDVLGTRQHGLPEFKVARLPEDAELLELARSWSIDLLAEDPELADQVHGPLRWALDRRFGALEVEPIAAWQLRWRCEWSAASTAGGACPRPGDRARGRRSTACARRCSASWGRSTAPRVLDLYAGSGALGIEALSRGAAEATFVDSDPAAVRAVRANLERVAARDARVFRADALSFLRGAARHGEGWDLVLVDPPYRLAARLGHTLGPLLAPVLGSGARIVCESSAKHPLRPDLPQTGERRYGETLLSLHRARHARLR